MIIPKGFTEQVKQHKKADVGYVQRMTSLATMSNINTGSDTALAVIQQAVKSTIYQDKLSSGAMTEDEMNQLEDPVLLSETTVVGDKADSEQFCSDVPLLGTEHGSAYNNVRSYNVLGSDDT